MHEKALRKNLAPRLLLLLLVFIVSFFLAKIDTAKADGLTGTFVRLDRMAAGAALSGTVCAKPSVGQLAQTEGKVLIAFPWTLAGTAANFAINSAPNLSWPTTGTTAPWPGIGTTAMSVSGTGVTIASGNLTSTAPWYCMNFTATGSTNGSAGADQVGTISTQTGASAAIDSGIYAVGLVSNDQVTITGTVNPTFSFTLSQTSTTFASITNAVATASPTPTVTIVTNARNGWMAWVKDANNGTLNSAGAGSNIPTPGAVGTNRDISTMSGPGAFGLGVTTSGGSSAPATEYNGATFTNNGVGTLSNSYRPAASSTAVASNDVITLLPRAIASTTQAPANDYTDTITIVAAGSF